MKEEKSVAEADLYAWQQSQKKKDGHGNDNSNYNEIKFTEESKMKAVTVTSTKEDDVCKIPHSPADIAAVHSTSPSSHMKKIA